MDKHTYNTYFQNIQMGEFDRSFTHAALLLGDGCKAESDPLDWDVCGATEYYTRARFVAEMMYSQGNRDEDRALLEKAERSLSPVLKNHPLRLESKVVWADISCLFEGFSPCDTISAQVEPMSHSSFRLTFDTDKNPKKMFICVPSLDICGLYSSFSVVAKPFSPREFIFKNANFNFNKVSGNVFYNNDEAMLSCGICNFEISKGK